MNEPVWQTYLKRNKIMKENSYMKNNTYHLIASVCQNILVLNLGKVEVC